MIRKNQKGSLLIEMMAIVGLLTLITPILFQQVHRRNEEVLNTQIATEMRMIKDGVTTFLEANEDVLAKTKCGLWNESMEAYNEVDWSQCTVDKNDIKAYLSGTDNAHNTTDSILDDYDIKIWGYTVPTKCEVSSGADSTKCEYRPELFALIMENSNLYSDKLRRKAKVASLIGAEGGVVDFSSGKILGVQGSWSMPVADAFGNVPTGSSGMYATAVVTFFNNVASSSILKDVRWQHLKATTAQADTIASEKLAARTLFTVGSKSNTSDCISGYGTNAVAVKSAAKDSTQLGANESANCDPFFEVDSASGEVRITSRIRTGVNTTTFYCERLKQRECELLKNYCIWSSTALACSGGEHTIDCNTFTGNSKTAQCNAVPGCTHDDSSTGCLACGAYNTQIGCETFAHGCVWLIDEGKCIGEYMLDPSRKSVMSDITVTNDITLKYRGENKSLIASLPNEVPLGSGIACSFDASVKSGNIKPGLNICIDGDYINGQLVRRSKIGTQCAVYSGNADVATWVGDFSSGNATYHGAIYFDLKCNRMKEPGFNPCTPNPTDASCLTTRVSCLNYCEKLGAKCYANNTNNNSIEAVRHCASDDILCQQCSASSSSCRRACLEIFDDDLTVSMNNDQVTYLTGIAVKTCYLARGVCAIQTYNDFDSTSGYVCADPRHYGYNIKLRISNVDRDIDANPGIVYQNGSLWGITLGGTLGLSIEEFCVPTM